MTVSVNVAGVCTCEVRISILIHRIVNTYMLNIATRAQYGLSSKLPANFQVCRQIKVEKLCFFFESLNSLCKTCNDYSFLLFSVFDNDLATEKLGLSVTSHSDPTV